MRPVQRIVVLLVSVAAALLPASLHAKTIVLTDEDCEQMAAIAAEAPRMSWAGYEASAGVFSGIFLDLYPTTRSFLIRYPIDRIPKGQKITKAEWVIPATLSSAGEQRLYVRRIIGEWGAGVCHDYRMTRPKKVEWNTPGGRGASKDRALKPSAVVRINGVGEYPINVTEDVELWYTGAAANNGWTVNLEDENSWVRLISPVHTPRGSWKLQITFEPE